MTSQLKIILSSFTFLEKPESRKVFLLALSFFLISWAFTCVGELKDALFIAFVGKESLKWAKLRSMFILIPAILLYSRLVDKLASSKLLYFYCTLYAFVSLLGAVYLSQVHGATQNIYFGWIFYFIMEGFWPFVVGLFWAFLNSISTPEESKKNYKIIVGASQLGGISAALFCWYILTCTSYNCQTHHQIILTLSACLLLLVPFIINFLFKTTPANYLEGYKTPTVQVESLENNSFLTQLFGGLRLFTKQPYILGIFGMLFFWEVVNVVFSYQRLLAGANSSSNLSVLSGLFFEQVFILNIIGLVIVLTGGGPLVSRLGQKWCLILIPTLIGILLAYYLVYPTTSSLSLVYVLLRAFNFAFASPLREALYIPTSSEMRFKSKSWIDVFGSRFAKTCGAYYNIFAANLAQSVLFLAHSLFFTLVISLWVIAAYFLGKRFEEAIEKNEIIGHD